MSILKADWNAVQELVDSIVHPRTGLEAIGFRKDGRPIWPVLGAQDNDGADKDSDTSGEDDSTDDASTDGTDNSGDDENNNDVVYTADEYKRLMARMQAADRNATALQKKLKELKDKDKPADQKLKEDHQELKTTLDSIAKERDTLRIQVAFLRSNDVEWHDPEDALTMADLSGVDIDDNGNVDKKALKASLKDLAKRKPHLVKTKKSKETDEDDDQEDQEDQGSSSGTTITGNRRKGSNDKDKMSREELAKKFPALRRR